MLGAAWFFGKRSVWIESVGGNDFCRFPLRLQGRSITVPGLYGALYG